MKRRRDFGLLGCTIVRFLSSPEFFSVLIYTSTTTLTALFCTLYTLTKVDLFRNRSPFRK